MSDVSVADLPTLLALARDIAAQAGSYIGERRRSPFTSSSKASLNDLVTDVDRSSEELIVSRIRAARPADAIVGEEGADRAGTSGVRWIIDPLDGTTNFVYGYPAYAVSIGVEVNREPVVGVVKNVATGEMFWAATGTGAFLDGQPIRVSTVTELRTALVGGGFGNNAPDRDVHADVLARVLREIADLRRGGSAALDLCAVAAGRLDAYFELHLAPWDYAAADVIIREAGGATCSLDGQRLHGATVLAATSGLIEPLRALLLRTGGTDTQVGRP